MKKLVLLIILAVVLTGCATEKEYAVKATPKGRYNVNLASSHEVGNLIIQAKPPSKQLVIKNYAIIIDAGEPILVFKHSDTYITLDAGKHTLKLYAPSGGIYGKMFGKATTKEINIEKDKTVIFEYTGPYWTMSEGTLVETR